MTASRVCKMCGKNREVKSFRPIGIEARCPYCFYSEYEGRPLFWQDYRAGKLFYLVIKEIVEDQIREQNQVEDERIVNEIRRLRAVNHILFFGKETPLSMKLLARTTIQGEDKLSTEPFRLPSESSREFILRLLFFESVEDGLTSEAVAYLKDYVETCGESSEKRCTGLIHLMNAMLYEKYGLFQEAQSDYSEALRTFGDISEHRLQLCVGLLSSRLYSDYSRYELFGLNNPQLVESGPVAALNLIRESLGFATSIGTSADVLMLQAYLVQSLLAMDMKKQATDLLTSLTSQLKKCRNWEFSYTLLNLAGKYGPIKPEQRLLMLSKATEIGDKYAPMWLNWKSWYELGNFYHNSKKDDKRYALFALRTALDRWNWAISFVHPTEARTRLRNQSQIIQKNLLDIATTYHDVDMTLLAMELGRDRLLLELLSGEPKFEGVPNDIMSEDEQFRHQIYQEILSKLIDNRSGNTSVTIRNLFSQDIKPQFAGYGFEFIPTQMESMVNRWRRAQNTIDEFFVVNGENATTATVNLIQDSLTPETVFVELHPIGVTSVALLAITKHEVRTTRLDVKNVWDSLTCIRPTDIVRMSDYKMLCEIPPEEEGCSEEEWREVASRFYAMEFMQIDDLICKANHIVFSAQGQGIPITAMCREGKYLIETHRMSFVSSASSWFHLLKARARKNESDTKIMSCFGNPLMGTLENPIDSNLPGALDEINAIRELNLPLEFRSYLGGEATAYVFLKEILEANILHIASHAYFVPFEPRLSSLLLAPCSERPCGNVDVIDILRSKVKARSVTLSSCNTGLLGGPRFDRYGFVNAFLASGAGTVLSSQWDVDDETAALMMKNYYSRLLSKSPAEALRLAQLAILENPQTSHPYFWASFFVSGFTE